MQNRFKCRVWDKKKGQFTDEYLDREIVLSLDGDVYAIAGDYDDNMNFYGINNDNQFVIEQCTGLKDKNGRLIYEGDICVPAKDMADKAGEVYRTGSGAYNIKGKMKSGMEYDFGIYWHHFMYEIIGNIHKNVDLLEKYLD